MYLPKIPTGVKSQSMWNMNEYQYMCDRGYSTKEILKYFDSLLDIKSKSS